MKTLVKLYRQLPANEKCILQVLAMCHHRDFSIGDLTHLLKEVHTHEPNLWPEPPKQATVRASMERLDEAKLACIYTLSMTRLGVVPQLADFCWQQAVLDGRFARLRDILFRRFGISDDSFYLSDKSRWLATVAFYQGDAPTFFSHCARAHIENARLINLGLMEAWDPALFHNLPPALQRETLMATLTRSVLGGHSTSDAIEQFKQLVLGDASSASDWSDLRV